MMLRYNRLLKFSGLLSILFLGTACSQVDFETTDEFLNANNLALTTVVINENAEFTNSDNVDLSLDGRGADEMKISQSADCSDGDWEPFVPKKRWILSKNNSEVAVFALFRVRGELVSDCKTDSILSDTESPTVTFVSSLGLWKNSLSQVVDFSVQDNFTGVGIVECSRDLLGWEKCQSTFAAQSGGEGIQYAYVRASDKANNLSEPQAFYWNVDLTAPVLTVHSQPSIITNNSMATVSFSATDNLSLVANFHCQLDSNPLELCSTPFIKSGLAEGAHTLKIKAIDRAGNTSPETVVSWSVDATAPTVTITKMPDIISSKNAGSFEFTGVDSGLPITQFKCSMDGVPHASCTSPVAFTGLFGGTHVFSVIGIDRAGNESSAASFTWIIDTMAPMVWFLSVPDKFSNTNPALFVMDAYDRAAVNGDPSSTAPIIKPPVYCSADGLKFSSCTLSHTLKLDSDGPQKFYAKAIDQAGNESAVISYEWLLDRVAPEIQITVQPDALSSSKSAALQMTATDNASGIDRYECKIDEQEYVACTSPMSYSDLAEGAHIFEARVYDKAGNVSLIDSANWVVDSVAPAITFVTVPATSLEVGGAADLKFDVSDGGAPFVGTLSCYLGGVLQASCVALMDYHLVQPLEGTFTFKVDAVDSTGNSSSNEVSWVVTAAPVVTSHETPISVAANTKVDVLFVVDNSGSMKTIQANMASRISGFLGNLVGQDWQIGFITTDVDFDNGLVIQDGGLLPLEGDQADLDSISHSYILNSSMGPAVVERLVGETLQREEKGSGYEQGIYATYRAVQRAFDGGVENEANLQFFRNDASLAVVLISDEDETATSGHQNAPQDLIDLVSSKWNGDKNLAFHSIIVKPGDLACLDERGWYYENGQSKRLGKYGYTYANLSNLLGGGAAGGSVIGSVCAANYAEQLSEIGTNVQNMKKSATLTCEPVDGSVKTYLVEPSGESPYAGGFTISGLKLVFDDFLPLGEYVVRYDCL